MWPFTRKPELTMAEIVADKPDVRCGNKERHYTWTMFNGMSCPVCFAIEKREREAMDRAELAKLIAAELAPLLIAATHPKEQP
jgi:hypothetical protein